jgi:hypothetical protein
VSCASAELLEIVQQAPSSFGCGGTKRASPGTRAADPVLGAAEFTRLLAAARPFAQQHIMISRISRNDSGNPCAQRARP